MQQKFVSIRLLLAPQLTETIFLTLFPINRRIKYSRDRTTLNINFLFVDVKYETILCSLVPFSDLSRIHITFQSCLYSGEYTPTFPWCNIPLSCLKYANNVFFCSAHYFENKTKLNDPLAKETNVLLRHINFTKN